MEKKVKLGQFIYENHDYAGSVEDFLAETAPLIGYIVHSFNSLDSQLNSSICSLISDRADEIGAIVIFKLNFSAKVDLFSRIVRSLEIAVGRTMPSFQYLCSNLKECSRLRNAVVHAEWENLDSEGYTYVKMSFEKDGMHQNYWQFTPDSLREIDQFINRTLDAFEVYEDELQDLYGG